MAVSLTASLFLAGCNPTQLANDLSTAVNQLMQDKITAEALVQDVKKSVPASDPGYIDTERAYVDAAAAYDGLLSAAAVAGNRGRSEETLNALATDVETKRVLFIRKAVRALDPSADTRSFPITSATMIPRSLTKAIFQVPQRRRAVALKEVRRQSSWRSWDSY